MSINLNKEHTDSVNGIKLNLTVLSDSLILLDLAVSVYLLFFNQYRELSQGVWFVFATQCAFLPFLILIQWIKGKQVLTTLKEEMHFEETEKKKAALFSELGEEILKPYLPKNEGLRKLFGGIIFLTITVDIIISANFLWVGNFIDSFSRSGGSNIGEIYYTVTLLYQAYYFTIILFSIFMILYLKSPDDIDELYHRSKNANTEPPITFIGSFKKLSKRQKNIIYGVSLLSIISLSGIGFAYYNLDDNTGKIDVPKISDRILWDIYNIQSIGNDKIQILGTSFTQNQYGRVYPEFTLVEYNLKTGQSFSFKLFDITTGSLGVLDFGRVNNDAYVLIHYERPVDTGVIKNAHENYTLYHINLETKQASILYNLALIIPRHIYNENWTRYNYNIIPFSNGVQFIQSDSYGAYPTNVTSISLSGDVKMQTNHDIIYLDGLTFNDHTYVLHLDPSSNFEHFALSKFDSWGMDLNWTQRETTTLLAKNSEAPGGNILPNGASLELVNGSLYYRSAYNFYSIDRNISSNINFEYLDLLRSFYSNTYQGAVQVGNYIVIQSERGVAYLRYSDLSLVNQAKGEQAGFITTYHTNLAYANGKVFSGNFDGKVYVWPSNPSDVKSHQNQISVIIDGSLIVYAILAMILIVLKKKWTGYSSASSKLRK